MNNPCHHPMESMDSIPNEILLEIIRYVGKEEIPKMRLVSTRFNLLATTCVQKSCQVKFRRDSDIAKFVTMFENKAVVPFENFGFCEDLLVYGHPLEQFCVQFGKLVKCWKFSGLECRRQNSLSQNLQVLLENCINVEEMGYIFMPDNVVKFTQIPVLRNLQTITISIFLITGGNFPLLLHQIVEKAPNLRSISIKSLDYESPSEESAADFLNQLYNMNATVRIHDFDIDLTLPETCVGDLEKLAAISTKFRIVNFSLLITLSGDHPERLPQQLEILPKWIPHLTPTRSLSLAYYDHNDANRSKAPITIPLHSVSSLQHMTLTNLAPCMPVVPGQQTEFPVLTTLYCQYNDDVPAHNFSFFGCVFPNVKSAAVCLKTEQEYEHWPRVLPNVEKLGVNSTTLQGIFQFPKLRRLDISIVRGVGVDVRQQHWNYLTGGATHVSDDRICSFPLNTPNSSDPIASFRNLPLLTELSIRGDTVECWKGVIYASRTGQLGRLQKLKLGLERFDLEELYRTELMKYHESVISGY